MPEVALSGQNWAHIGNLTPNEEYYFRVVAVNGLEPDTRETRSHPPWKEVIGKPHGERTPNSELTLHHLCVFCILSLCF